jgi:hypothetical protein
MPTNPLWWQILNQYLQMINSLIVFWLPVANALVSIWINRPYREAVQKLFSKTLYIFTKKNSANIVHPNPVGGQ